jgi:hypothetical protein
MRPIDRPLALLGAVVAASLLGVSPLAAQCLISGPSVICGGTARLCAPEGNFAAEWIGPNGFSSTSLCITVSEPGTYSLYLFDLSTGGGSSCDHTLSTNGTPPSASITGPASACNGENVQLCGPTGDFDYAWTLPGGGSATGACIAASGNGSYALTVTDRSTGCVSTPATHDFAFTTCDTTPPPPPPPPPGQVACPRTASFWSAQCKDAAPASRRIARAQMGSLASCVDGHANLFSWIDAQRGSLPDRARRQFTAVAANLCAAEMGMTQNGVPIGLDAGLALTIAGAPATVGEWLAQADAQLMELDAQGSSNKAVADGYRTVLRAAWLINHGQGTATSCPSIALGRSVGGNGGFDDGVVLEPDDRSLTAALAESESQIRLERPTPNPFQGISRIGWSLDAEQPAPVRIVIHDLAGRAVRVLVDGFQSPGSHELSWDGRAEDGRELPRGVYFLHASTGGQLLQTRITLIR